MKEDLGQWLEENLPRHNMSYADAAHAQFTFVYDNILYIKQSGDHKDIYVVGAHISKSIKLPVYQFELNDKVVTMRCNFHNWIVSVESETPIIGLNTLDLFDHKNAINPTHCEGMEDIVYGSYIDYKKEFTIRLDSDYDLYCILRLISASPNYVLTEFLPEDI